MEASKADQGYVYVIGLRDTGVIIGEIMLTEVVRGICRAAGSVIFGPRP